MAKAEGIDSKIVTQNETLKGPRNIFSLFPKIELKFPFFNEEKEKAVESVVKEDEKNSVVEEEQKPNFVSFPNTNHIVPPVLGVEVEESSGRTHNPIVIWQVYALGGFIILKWVWARWKERNERAKKASDDDDQSSDEYQSPADDNE